jgi:cytochrome b561
VTGPVDPAYSGAARAFHWFTALLVFVTFPVGVIMHWRGSQLGIWDATTNNLFSTHKLLGFVILWLVVARLAYRLAHGAPEDEPTLEPWQKYVSHVVHWALYALLVAVPLLGWIGVQLYPAVTIFDTFALPSFLTPDKALAEQVFAVHGLLAFALIGLIAMHVGAALFHHLVRRDGVLVRMWPGASRWR